MTEGIVWHVQGTAVMRRMGPAAEQVIREAHALLTDPKFHGPDQQFAKAIAHLNSRPEPDLENCVKDSIGALEAVANILAGTRGQHLNVLLEKDPFKSLFHPAIRQCIDKLYAYRGAAPGVSHGLVGESGVSVDEALWALQMAAATIILMVNKCR